MTTTRILLTIILAAAIAACSNNTQKEQPSEQGIMQVDQVMKDPAAQIDQTITLEGVVTHVCKHGGKRLHLSKAGSDEIVRVRIAGDLPPFDRELEGSTVQITGMFVEERLDQAYLNQLRKGEKEADHHHEGDVEAEHAEAAEVGQVSEEFIKEMQAKIDNSEKGFITEYWLNAEKLKKTENK